MDLGVSLEGTRERQRGEREREQALEEGQDCTIVLQLPDGSQHTHVFKLGSTVAYLKLRIQQLYEVPQERQVLRAGGKTLIDPCELGGRAMHAAVHALCRHACRAGA
jgi:hypothetical protein